MPKHIKKTYSLKPEIIQYVLQIDHHCTDNKIYLVNTANTQLSRPI